MSDDIQRRKDRHVDIVLQQDVVGHGPAVGLGHFTLEYDALPEIDLVDVDLSTTVFGKRLSAPLIIGAMTGGTDRTGQINRTLAIAAERTGVGMALGSQRPMLVDPSLTSTYAVREAAPGLPLLLGNLGAVQLNYGVKADDVRRLVRDVGADAINLHLNALQEAIQPEGDTRFSGLVDTIRQLVPQIGVPVVLKEVGAGISARAAHKLAQLPIAGVEVAGTGGTSWAAVESWRAGADAKRQHTGQALAGFGVPTSASLRIARHHLGDKVLIASGGLRSGMDLAVALAMGADAVALAKPLLEAAVLGVDETVAAIEALIFELRVIAFCCGASDLDALRRVRVIDLRAGWPLV